LAQSLVRSSSVRIGIGIRPFTLQPMGSLAPVRPAPPRSGIVFPPPTQLGVSPPFLFVASFLFTRRAPPPEGSCSADLGFCPSTRVSHPFQRDAATHYVIVVRPFDPAIGAHVGSPHTRRRGAGQERKLSPARVTLALHRPEPASFEKPSLRRAVSLRRARKDAGG